MASPLLPQLVKLIPPILLLLFIFSNFYFFHIQSTYSLSELPIFALFSLVLLSYIKCIITFPGKVPTRFDFVEESAKKRVSHSDYTSELKPALASFCERCLKGRPARAHHCSQCGVCILKRDHHCIWIQNCVGLLNHKHFIHLLGYGGMTTSLIACTLYPNLTENYEKSSNWEIFGFFLNFVTCVCLSFMTIYHLWLVFSNKTMIDLRYIVKDTVFNVDLETNIKSQIGSNVFLWFFPLDVQLPVISFPVKLQKIDGEQEIISDLVLVQQKE